MSQSGTNVTNNGPSGFVQTINGATPSAGNINLTSTGGTIVITPGAHTVNLETNSSGIVMAVHAGNNITITGTPTIPVVNVSGTVNNSVLLGNGAGSISSLANGTTGQILTAVTGASPSWQANPDAGSFSTDSGTATPLGGVLNIIAGFSTQSCGSSVEFTGFGNTVLLNVTDINNNTIIGSGSGAFMGGSDTFNVVLGIGAFTNASNSLGNVAIGNYAMSNNPSAGNMYNAVLGHQGLPFLSGGSYNIALGVEAGGNYTSTESYNICINDNGTSVTGENNTLRIGAGTGSGMQQLTQTFISGIGGVNLSTANIVTESSNQLGTAVLTAGSGISILSNIAPNEIIVSNTGVISVVTDSGTATPLGGVLNIIAGVSSQHCGSSVEFTGTGSTVTLNVTDGNNNTIIGFEAGNASISGNNNTALGQGAFINATTAVSNVAIGNGAAASMNEGEGNIAIGYLAGAGTGASENTCIGFGAGVALLLGSENTCIGAASGNSLTSGGFNSFLGANAAGNLVSGNNNIAIGATSSNSSGDNWSGAESNNIAIGNEGTMGDSGVIYIGTDPVVGGSQTTCFIAGIANVTTGVADAVPVLISASTAQLGVTSSSLRYKDNVEDMGEYSSLLMRLRPVTFNYKNHPPTSISVGLIAEEVDKLMPALVVYKDTHPETIKYQDLTPMLLNELQKLRKEFDEYKKETL